MEKQSILERMLGTAEEIYGREEAERLKPIIESLSESIWKVQCFELEPGDEPSTDLREDR
jgi:hypothetical protein